MRRLTVFFTIAFAVCLVLRILFEYYVDTVPVFGALLTLLTWLSAGSGVVMSVFILLIVIKAFRKGKDD